MAIHWQTSNMQQATQDDNGTSDYNFPPEWSPHAACLILYPHNASAFRLEAQNQVLDITRAICYEGQEDALLFCLNQEQANLVKQRL